MAKKKSKPQEKIDTPLGYFIFHTAVALIVAAIGIKGWFMGVSTLKWGEVWFVIIGAVVFYSMYQAFRAVNLIKEDRKKFRRGGK